MNSTTIKQPTNTALVSVLSNTTSLLSSSGVTLVNLSFDGNGAEMGFFFFLSILSVLFLLDQLDGRIFRMKIYLMNRDYNLVRNQHVITAITYFIRGISWFAITLPFLALGVWAAGLIIRALDQGVNA